jgi:hypothetical protein
MSHKTKTGTLSPELVARCREWAHGRVEYLQDELAKAEAAGDFERAASLLCDLFGDDACCYVDDPYHAAYKAAHAALEARMGRRSDDRAG